jgi:FG-GAP-like repeat/Abnormal spindle-like microcephaly-assoc'd, ASPM-SPD-2-Hydin
VLLGFGDGTFVGKKDYAAGNGPSVVVSADFNHDGNLDLAVPSTLVANSVSILLGNGDGTFQPKLSSTTGPLPFAAAVGDLNGDGSIDLVTPNMTCPNQPCGPGSVSVLLGKGDGTLQPYVEYATGVGPLSVTVGDFNGDGRADLAVGTQGLLSILLGNYDTAASPQLITLIGAGLGPLINLSAASLTFASQGLGTSSSPQSVVVTNTGGAPLSFAQISVTGDFAQTNNCPASLAAAANCTISVTFTPTVNGARTGNVTLTDSDPTGTQVISLSGTGSEPVVESYSYAKHRG